MDTVIDMTGRTPDAEIIAAPATTPLQALAAKLAPLDVRTINLQVDPRPGFVVTYKVPTDGAQLTGWRRAAATEPDNSSTVDEDLWHRIILVAQCVSMTFEGEKVLDGQGKPVTFRSAELWQMLHVPAGSPDGATLAAHRFYGSNDFEVNAAATKLLADGGLGKVARVADPTSGPSTS